MKQALTTTTTIPWQVSMLRVSRRATAEAIAECVTDLGYKASVAGLFEPGGAQWLVYSSLEVEQLNVLMALLNSLSGMGASSGGAQ